MKKRFIISLLIITSLFVITGCGSKKDKPVSENKANEILNNQSDNNSSSKILVVYFSRTGENYNVGNIEVGNTAIMASFIKEYLNADSFEIIPVNKYPESYDECLKVATKEKEENARPAIESKIDDISKYDTIFIGYPIWWGEIPQIIYTFMEEYDLSNKTIIPFNTHEGSGSAGTYNTIKSKLSNSKVNTNGLALQGKTARTDEGKEKTIEWLKELGY